MGRRGNPAFDSAVHYMVRLARAFVMLRGPGTRLVRGVPGVVQR